MWPYIHFIIHFYSVFLFFLPFKKNNGLDIEIFNIDYHDWIQNGICQGPYRHQHANNHYQDRVQNRSKLQDQVWRVDLRRCRETKSQQKHFQQQGEQRIVGYYCETGDNRELCDRNWSTIDSGHAAVQTTAQPWVAPGLLPHIIVQNCFFNKKKNFVIFFDFISIGLSIGLNLKLKFLLNKVRSES